MDVPAGDAVIHVEKGKEYRQTQLKVSVKPGESVEKTVALKRWIDMPARGWYSADLHVHLGHDEFGLDGGYVASSPRCHSAKQNGPAANRFAAGPWS